MRVPRSVTYVDNTAAAIEDVTELQAVMEDASLSFPPPACIRQLQCHGVASFKEARVINSFEYIFICVQTPKNQFIHFSRYFSYNAKQMIQGNIVYGALKTKGAS